MLPFDKTETLLSVCCVVPKTNSFFSLDRREMRRKEKQSTWLFLDIFLLCVFPSIHFFCLVEFCVRAEQNHQKKMCFVRSVGLLAYCTAFVSLSILCTYTVDCTLHTTHALQFCLCTHFAHTLGWQIKCWCVFEQRKPSSHQSKRALLINLANQE